LIYDDGYFTTRRDCESASAATTLAKMKDDDNNDEWEFVEAILDSGCTTTLLGSETEHLLTNKRQSTTYVRGFEGTNQVRGRIHGTAHVYFMSTRPNKKGRQMDITVDTIPTLNCPLFSISSLYSKYGFSIVLRHPTDGDGTCEIMKQKDKAREGSIPMAYDYERNAFMMKMVIAKSPKLAIERGEVMEKQLQDTMNRNNHISNATHIAIRDLPMVTKLLENKHQSIAHGPIRFIGDDGEEAINHASNFIPNEFNDIQAEFHMREHDDEVAMVGTTKQPTRRQPTRGCVSSTSTKQIQFPGASKTGHPRIGDSYQADIPPLRKITNVGKEDVSDGDKTTQDEENAPIEECKEYMESDARLSGVKDGMTSREKKMTKLELHKKHEHIELA